MPFKASMQLCPSGQAGEIIRKGISQENTIEEKSSSYDLVTNIDRECEAEITKAILSKYPDHQIVGEETASDEDIEAISAMVILLSQISSALTLAMR